MKRRLLSGVAIAALSAAAPAIAADTPLRAPVYRAASLPIFNWTGFYAGGHVGYGWGDAENLSPDGWFGGGQIGYNWQFSPNWVFGFEGDIAGADLNSSNGGGVPLASSKANLTGTARARLGYTTDRLMAYGTGGFAWAHNRATDFAGFHDDKLHVGWTLGAGVEYAFAPNWSTKIEYLYADYGSENYSLAVPTNVDLKTNTVKLGINYLFGGPVYSRY
jgi:outer membrane immunogenic protein